MRQIITYTKQLKEFLTLHNDVENYPFLSAENILKEWKEFQSIYNEWSQDELLDPNSKNDGKSLSMYLTPYWIPFFDLNNSRFAALDFAPNTQGVSGQVINQEMGGQVAESLSAFLKNLINNK